MKNIAILFGGYSSEARFLFESAYYVIKSVDTSRFNPILIWVSKDGDWYLYEGDIENIKEKQF